jgi:DNA-binding response OmpR family regulator
MKLTRRTGLSTLYEADAFHRRIDCPKSQLMLSTLPSSQLLSYMMERSDQLLTRTTLLKEIWNYKFASKTNLVDVHIGRLRRTVDGPNEPRMLRSVHGAGFILNAVPESRSEVEESLSAHRILQPGNNLFDG